MDSDLLTSPEAAQLTGFTLAHLAWLCRNNKIECTRRGRDWFISRRSLVAYMATWHPEKSIDQDPHDG